MGKIILNLAMSIDGYIADQDGGYDWIQGDGKNIVSTEQRWDFPLFLEAIDWVIMGKSCFDQGMHRDFSDKEIIVITHQPMEDYDNIHFMSEAIIETVVALKEKQNKTLYIFGGGRVADLFIRQDCIDEYIIGVIPVLLGTGIPLFYEKEERILLTLTKYMIEDGIAVFYYDRRR